jgi:hypothetical protein
MFLCIVASSYRYVRLVNSELAFISHSVVGQNNDIICYYVLYIQKKSSEASKVATGLSFKKRRQAVLALGQSSSGSYRTPAFLKNARSIGSSIQSTMVMTCSEYTYEANGESQMALCW